MHEEPDFIISGPQNAHRKIALLTRSGSAPGIFFLGGFKSEMTGTKATALDSFGAKHGFAVTRFDYSGHGQSRGDFLDGTISNWLEDALAAFATTRGPQIVIGSSMGGWLALLLNRALRENSNNRVKALILIAPAVDMTEDLMRATFTEKEHADLEKHGQVEQPSDYSDEPYILTRALIEDGADHLLFGHGSIETGCPVHILQGAKDEDVPAAHAQKLLAHLTLDPVTFTLVPDGNHSLSRPQDLTKLNEIIIDLARD